MGNANAGQSWVSRYKWQVMTGVVVLLLVLDQVSKEIAIHFLKGRATLTFLGDTFRLQYAENKGAFLSLGAGLSEGSRFWILGVIVLAFLALYSYHLLKGAPSREVVAGISLVVGGGISNLIDRFFRAEGSVIDFMNMGIGSLRTGIFNIADMAIVAGVLLLFYDSWLAKRRSQPSVERQN
ncbi:MAG: signal peptidase II [Bdellovibrionaceae bacterium]|nr:signal peptidase II [Bdellovibrionales bacterium]MCB9085029.1 signal peptidase II [Pseudobdellovibrionaceae bacterium]